MLDLFKLAHIEQRLFIFEQQVAKGKLLKITIKNIIIKKPIKNIIISVHAASKLPAERNAGIYPQSIFYRGVHLKAALHGTNGNFG